MRFLLKTKAKDEIIDITSYIGKAVSKSGIKDGVAVIFAPGTTCGLTIIEHEPGMMNDLRLALDKIAPKEASYKHNKRNGDGNGYSHIKGAFFAGSLTVPIENNKLRLGVWQSIVLLEFDNKPRTREVLVKIIKSK